MNLSPAQQAAAVVQHQAAQTNTDKFYETLAGEYAELFKTPKYAAVARKQTPETLARIMTNFLACGSADKDGEGVQAALKKLGIKNTYKALRAYLAGGDA